MGTARLTRRHRTGRGIAGRAAIAIAAIATSLAAPAAIVSNLTFLAQTSIALGTLDTNGREIGGLSGLAYSGVGSTFFAISDAKDVPRFYTLDIDVANGGAPSVSASITGVTSLGNPPPFPAFTADPEGIAFSGSNLYVASEGLVNGAVHQPFITGFNVANGQQTATSFPIAPKFLFDTGSGIEANRRFESLSVTPDGQTLVTAIERGLEQDASSESARILTYDIASSAQQGEFLYELELNNGLSELLALNDTTFLALERPVVAFSGALKLFEVSTAGATDISALDTLPGSGITPVTKSEVPGFALALDNYEGLALLPGDAGSSTLLVLSDNNFGAFSPFFTHTQIAAFEIHAVPLPPAFLLLISGISAVTLGRRRAAGSRG